MLMLSLLPWTILPLPSLLSAHSFLVFFADKREKILLFVVGEIVVLVEDIEAVTMLYLETLVGSALFSVFSPT